MSAALLSAAGELLERDGAQTAGMWPRASAFLARQALEEALDDLWRSRRITQGLENCPKRTQLLCLPTYLDEALAARVAWTWSALSAACHHHAYDIAPTAAELGGWIEVVGELVEAVLPRSGVPFEESTTDP